MKSPFFPMHFRRSARACLGVAAAGCASVAATGCATLSTSAACHGDGDPRLNALEQKLAKLELQLAAHAQPFSGQGKAIFSWAQDLTEAFPADAQPFEKDMHGGFSEVCHEHCCTIAARVALS